MTRLQTSLLFVAFLALLLQSLTWHHDSEMTTRVCVEKSPRPELCAAAELRTNEGMQIK